MVRGDEADGFNAEAQCPDDLTEVVVPPTPTPPTDTSSSTEDDDSRVEADTSFTFIGCFADDRQDRVLELVMEDPDSMTVEVRATGDGTGHGIDSVARRSPLGYTIEIHFICPLRLFCAVDSLSCE